MLVKIALSSLLDSIASNYHAYINCSSISSLPSVECSTLSQLRYRLHGQSQILRISISAVSALKPVNLDERFTSSDESPAEILTDSNLFEVLSVGSNPFLCFYQISRDTNAAVTSSRAFSVAKSLYGAVRSLAGFFFGGNFSL